MHAAPLNKTTAELLTQEMYMFKGPRPFPTRPDCMLYVAVPFLGASHAQQLAGTEVQSEHKQVVVKLFVDVAQVCL